MLTLDVHRWYINVGRRGYKFSLSLTGCTTEFISLLSVEGFGRDAGRLFKISLLMIRPEMSNDSKAE